MKENLREYLEEMKDRDCDEDRALKEKEDAAEAQHRIDQAAKTKFDPNAKDDDEEAAEKAVDKDEENTTVSETDSNEKKDTEADKDSDKTV